MKYIYSAGLWFYYLGILIASFFNPKARLWIRGRKDVFRQLQEKVKNDPLIWIHAASLGEFEQGRPVMEEIRRRYPAYKILLTFFSPSGYEIRKHYNGADYVFYLPRDTRRNATHFVNLVKPAMAIFVKYEFWYHYIHQLSKSNIPVYLISGIFRPDQVFFRWYGSWFRKILFFFTHLFVQTEESLKLLHSVKVNHATQAGDTRFDRVLQIASAIREIPVASAFKGDIPCLIAGSTWPDDEKFLLQYVNETKNQAKFIIAPHEVQEEHIQRITGQLKKSYVRFSQAEESNVNDFQVLIIDNIGMLSSLYRYGDVAYIGGGFGKGIHNVLEAATFGLPVIFGPRYKKFSEAVELVQMGGACSFSVMEDLANRLDHWLEDSEGRSKMGKISRDFVHRNAGATEIILNRIFPEQSQQRHL
jgi:3-deoxy-D-manno-octulosonic-acid transferase